MIIQADALNMPLQDCSVDAVVKTEINKPEIPETWDYEESVQKVKAFVYKWTNLTDEIAQELKNARKILNSQGRRTDLTSEEKFRSWTQYCEDIGSSRQVINHWLKEWFKPKELPHIAQATGENEWYTPPEYIEAARYVMGTIDLDPASSDVANQTIKAEKYFTIENDGLKQKWYGNIWMNPPYAQPLVDKFSEAISSKYESGEIKQACILVNNATETKWFQRMLDTCRCICFIRGRVQFINQEGSPSGAPLQGQAVLYFGNKENEFAREFSKFGPILWRK